MEESAQPPIAKRHAPTGHPGPIIYPEKISAQAWLTPLLGLTGEVIPPDCKGHMPELIQEATGQPWKSNANRHSFGSYRWAEVQDLGRVSREMGNTMDVCQRHYANPLLTPEQAKAYFGILPSAPANVANL